MRNTPGTTLTEVMVMMVILWISLVGIFSLVDSGQKLAALTDTRLMGVNIAREGLESVTTLRDTFSLANFASSNCAEWGVTTPAFFTTDGHQILDVIAAGGDNCPITANNPPVTITSVPYYSLLDDNALGYKALDINGGTDVCVNKFGWYSQEFSDIGAKTLAQCRIDPTGCTVCSAESASCGAGITRTCKTKFKRKITFEQCKDAGGASVPTLYCLVARSTVWW